MQYGGSAPIGLNTGKLLSYGIWAQQGTSEAESCKGPFLEILYVHQQSTLSDYSHIMVI